MDCQRLVGTWKILRSGLVLACFMTNAAYATDEPIHFHVPTRREVKLIRAILGSDPIERKLLRQWPISMNKDIRVARFRLIYGTEPEVLIFNMNPAYCASDGCSLSIWHKNSKGWQQILGDSAADPDPQLIARDRMTHGFHDLWNADMRHTLIFDVNSYGCPDCREKG